MSGRVLIADDEADIRILLRLSLKRIGVDVDEAADGDDALQQASSSEHRAVVLDHKMPGRSGADVARELRRAGVDTPIALFSAYLDPDLEGLAARFGVAAYGKSDLEGLVAWVSEHSC